MTLGEQLRRQRILRGIDQHALAKQFGVSRETLRKWEFNYAKPDRLHREAIVRFLNSDPNATRGP